jgi:hypothetical protein
MRPNPLDLPDFDYVITRADGRGFDLAVDCMCERCEGPTLVLTGATVARVPHGARRLDFALPCDCPTWLDHAVTAGKAVGFVAAGVAAYVFVCGIMLL